MPLTQVLPILQRLGVDVIDEHPYEINRANRPAARILTFGVILPDGGIRELDSLFSRFCEAFRACWDGRCGIDTFNALVVTAGVDWRQAMIIRAYARYLRQIGSTFGQGYLEQVVLDHSEISRMLIELFEARFDPEEKARSAANRGPSPRTHQASPGRRSEPGRRSDPAAVPHPHSCATVRTNFYAISRASDESCSVAFKLEPGIHS